ncbi:MAG TPA: hypothetical protein VMM81_07185 [Acidimicrobiia bacterium]|nr:hypothetical protein [Acidimicrobiia bacterium]
MLVITGVLVVGFIALGAATVLSVTGANGPQPPTLADLPIPTGVELVDSHTLCEADACDGAGGVFAWDPIRVEAAVGMLAEHFLGNGWIGDPGTCLEGVRCFQRGGLRSTIRPWLEVDETVGTTMRASIREQGIIEDNLVYVSVIRCGILTDC